MKRKTKKKIRPECQKCDERGMVENTPKIPGVYSAHSCSCGKNQRLMKARFKNVSFTDLMNYGLARVEYKKQLSNCFHNIPRKK